MIPTPADFHPYRGKVWRLVEAQHRISTNRIAASAADQALLEALVDEVDDLATRGPHAGQIVTLALVSHAGYWMNDPAMFDLLHEVDELSAGFHHLVGLTVPGWLSRYAHDDVAFTAALAGVADVFEILPELLLQWSDSIRTNEEGPVWRAWCRHRP